MVSVDDVGTYEVAVDFMKSQFFRIREVDRSAPELRFVFPSQSDIGVGRFEALRLSILDESDVDVGSIELKLPSGERISVRDSRLEYIDGELRFTPSGNTPLGPEGEDVVYSISVSDRLGNRVHEFPWRFTVEVPVIIAEGAQGIGQPIPQPLVRRNLNETAEIIDATLDQVVLRYSEAVPLIDDGQLLWSNDPRYPFYWRVLTSSVDASTKTVTIATLPARLEDVIKQGSFNTSQIVEIDPLTNAPLVQAADFGVSIGAGFQYGDQFSQAVVDEPEVKLTASIDWTHQGSLRVAGSIRDSELRELRIRSPQSIDVTASSTLWTGDAVSADDLAGKKIPTSWKLFEREREFVTWVGAVPVWMELTFTVEGGYSFEITGIP